MLERKKIHNPHKVNLGQVVGRGILVTAAIAGSYLLYDGINNNSSNTYDPCMDLTGSEVYFDKTLSLGPVFAGYAIRDGKVDEAYLRDYRYRLNCQNRNFNGITRYRIPAVVSPDVFFLKGDIKEIAKLFEALDKYGYDESIRIVSRMDTRGVWQKFTQNDGEIIGRNIGLALKETNKNTTWEFGVVNEPNFGELEWGGRADPLEFFLFYKAFSDSLYKEFPQARVVLRFPALSHSVQTTGGNMSPNDFIGILGEIKIPVRAFNGFSLHVYDGEPNEIERQIAVQRRALEPLFGKLIMSPTDFIIDELGPAADGSAFFDCSSGVWSDRAGLIFARQLQKPYARVATSACFDEKGQKVNVPIFDYSQPFTPQGFMTISR